VRRDPFLLRLVEQLDEGAVGARERPLRRDLTDQRTDADLLHLGVFALFEGVGERAADLLQVRADRSGEGKNELKLPFCDVFCDVVRYVRDVINRYAHARLYVPMKTFDTG
jgi:hypothetical protein